MEFRKDVLWTLQCKEQDLRSAAERNESEIQRVEQTIEEYTKKIETLRARHATLIETGLSLIKRADAFKQAREELEAKA